MDLHQFCAGLGFGQAAEETLRPHWEELCSRTTEGVPFFLKREFFSEYLPLCRLPEEGGILERMEEVGRIAARHPVCARYAAMLHHAYYLATPAIPLDSMPLPEKPFGENAGIFQLLAAMSALPLIARRHREMGLPERLAADAALWLRGTVAIYAAAHGGVPGFTLQQASWLRFSVDGRLFRLGRLEYLLGRWSDSQPAVYRRRSDRALRALCGDGWRFDAAGDLLPGGAPPEETVFVSRLLADRERITGTPIRPDGTIDRDRQETLELREWEAAVAPWDLVPSIHIPGGGESLRLEVVKDSMTTAREFFHRRLGTEPKAFVCNSWIFNPVWQRELPGSHLAAWQRNVYLLPPVLSPDCGLFFIYGRRTGDPRTMQRTTGLHEAFCRIYERGETLKYGGSFFLAEDLEEFGTEVYRRRAGGPAPA